MRCFKQLIKFVWYVLPFQKCIRKRQPCLILAKKNGPLEWMEMFANDWQLRSHDFWEKGEQTFEISSEQCETMGFENHVCFLTWNVSIFYRFFVKLILIPPTALPRSRWTGRVGKQWSGRHQASTPMWFHSAGPSLRWIGKSRWWGFDNIYSNNLYHKQDPR